MAAWKANARRVVVLAAMVAVLGVVLFTNSARGRPDREVRSSAVPPSVGASLDSNRTITASGHGQVEGAPDLLAVTLGVQSSGPKAETTLARNNDEARTIISALEAEGVEAKDIQTSQLAVGPIYDQPKPDQPPRLVGYQASDIVTANIHQLDRGGAIIDRAVAAGGNDSQVQGISFSVANPGPLLARARATAVRQATDDARAMAAAAGLRLGALRSISDTPNSSYQPCCTAALPASPATAGGPGNFGSAPLQPGTQVFSADVVAVFDIG